MTARLVSVGARHAPEVRVVGVDPLDTGPVMTRAREVAQRFARASDPATVDRIVRDRIVRDRIVCDRRVRA